MRKDRNAERWRGSGELEDTKHVTSGHWLFIKGAGCCLLLVIIWLTGCSPLQPTVIQTIEPRPTTVPTRVSPTATSRLQLLSTVAISPTWSQVELPPGCFFHSLSPDLRWIVMMGCRHDLGDTSWIVQVDENGRLYNFRQIESRLVPYDEGIGIMGYTSDSSRFIVERNETYWLINLADLTQEPFTSGIAGASGIEHFGSERWSSNGRFWLSPDCWGCGQVFVSSPSDQTKEMVLEDIGRHGAQFNWSADGKGIVYVEGDYHEGMKARVIELQSRQSRTLVESQYPASLTGASYSHDGKWIAVREQNIESSEDATLWLIDARTGAKIQITYNLLDVEVYNGWQDLVWAPDSSMLALRGTGEHNVSFVVIEIPGGKIVYRGTRETAGYPLAWSADGKSLLVLDFHEEPDSAVGNDILRWVQIK